MTTISRRSFIGGTSMMLAAGMMAGMAGCAFKGSSESETPGAAAATVAPDEERECDILVIGAGASGLTASLEAALSSAKVVCVEGTPQAGGNAFGIEGVFGVGSKMCREANIDVSTGALVRKEMDMSQYRGSSLALVDMIHASGENIDWLVDNGVLFDRVDTYVGDLPVFHWFATGSGAESFIAPLYDACVKAGVEFVFETHGDSLVVSEDGRIIGAMVTNNGNCIQYNAKAVIVATGGFADNKELLAEIGFGEDTPIFGAPGHDGSGHIMCVNAGAASNLQNASPMGGVWVDGVSFAKGLSSVFNIIWVNENGERFVNEDLGTENPMGGAHCLKSQERVYGIFDNALMEEYLSADGEAFAALLAGEKTDQHEVLEEAIAKGIAFKAETLDELAKLIEIDGTTFAATIKRFNDNCKTGEDRDFGKSPAFLASYGDGPYYAIRISDGLACILGSVVTDRNYNALTEDKQPIEGLYVTGLEGAMLWANLYTMNISGSCCANNVYSGRTAARHAIEHCINA